MATGEKWTDTDRAARLDGLVARNRARRDGAFLYEDADWMRDAYVTRGLTIREVAAEAECGVRTIARWMVTHGIESRREWPRPTGPDHHNWNGGPPRCPVCDGPRSSRNSKSCQKCQDRSGERGSNWRGDAVEYTGLHFRLKAVRGMPSQYRCQTCGGEAQEWAYDHADPDERRNHSGRDDGPYSLDLDHYLPLCTRCHRRFDLGR